MTASLASAITRAASKQTYYTIRFLVDRARVEDAFRAYAYFRWVGLWSIPRNVQQGTLMMIADADAPADLLITSMRLRQQA